jgi:hypothetical protein
MYYEGCGGVDGSRWESEFMIVPQHERPIAAGMVQEAQLGAYRPGAQFGCGVLRHTAGPHKPFASKFV